MALAGLHVFLEDVKEGKMRPKSSMWWWATCNKSWPTCNPSITFQSPFENSSTILKLPSLHQPCHHKLKILTDWGTLMIDLNLTKILNLISIHSYFFASPRWNTFIFKSNTFSKPILNFFCQPKNPSISYFLVSHKRTHIRLQKFQNQSSPTPKQIMCLSFPLELPL